MTTEEQRWRSRQKSRRAFMGMFFAVLVLLGGAAIFMANNNAEDSFVPSTQVENEITGMRPTTIPDTPPPIPLPDTVPLPSGDTPPTPPS